jgi:hypothetical protein
MPLLWVQADPGKIEVSVASPDGRRYAGASRDEHAPVVIQLADRGSSSSDEAELANFLGANATLVGWNESAPPGTYTIRLAGKALSSPIQVTLRQITTDALGKEIEAKANANEKRLAASLYAVPERHSRLDAQGNATLTLTGAWSKDDAILIGSTFQGRWNASVRLPDGTTITEANVKQSNCDWMTYNIGGDPLASPLELSTPGIQLSISCPERMKSGSMTITLRAGVKGAGMQLAAAVMSASAVKAAFAKEEQQFSLRPQTVALFHKPEGSGQPDYIDGVVDRPVTVRLGLRGGASPIVEATVSGMAYTVDLKRNNSLHVFGPDPAKKPSGTIPNVTRQPDGDFLYTFTGHQPGSHQLDLEAEGVFQNGRRFSADAIITVFVHRKAASLTRVRQQRIDRNNSGKADQARFLLDLDVIEPGHYAASVQVGNQPNDTTTAYAEAVLAAGRQTMVVEGDAKLVAKLEANPGAELNIGVADNTRRPDDDFPSKVVIDIAIPKAGEFEAPAAARSGTTSAGATWQVSNAGLAVTLPVAASGTGCQWAETIEINPKQTLVNQLIRTVGYRQSGTFVAQNGQTNISSLWSLAAFFEGAPQPAKQAFVFRLKEVGCGPNRGWVQNYDTSGNDAYVMPFSVDLSGLQLSFAAGRGTAVAPRVAGLATMEPLDKDRDGKFDYLKASFDLDSPGGTCIWMGNIGVEGMGWGTGGRAETRPGINRVSMEMSVTLTMSLRDHPLFRFYIDQLKCGINPEFTREDFQAASMNQTVLFEQEFAIDTRRFAAQGEFKPF